MTRIVAVLLLVAGFVCALAALVVPWARLHVVADVTAVGEQVTQSHTVSLLGLTGGSWYLGSLFLIGTLGAAAVSGTLLGRRVAFYGGVPAGAVGVFLALATVQVVGSWNVHKVAAGFVDAKVTATPQPGYLVGVAAAALLGAGVSALALSRNG